MIIQLKKTYVDEGAYKPERNSFGMPELVISNKIRMFSHYGVTVNT